ncbi:GPP34 family phosphoprotein [Streptomyces sp. NPDC087294]|uniref:GOLPH3/VPS74 family protein n=1 Tax=Streptomyces sp. NPDC087294 TaxID=3365777 RepID=UPI0037FDB355
MDLTLAQRIYLISYTPEKHDFTNVGLQFRGQRLRAAALTELVAAGRIGVEDGKALRLGSEPPVDRYLAEVWGQVSAERPDRWLDLVHGQAHTAEAPVRAQLLAAGVVREPEHRRLGPLAHHHVVLASPDEVIALREAVRGAVLGDADGAGVALFELAAAVICTEGEASVLFDGRERRAHKETLKAFGERFDEVVPGLRPALLASILSNRAVGGGWG